MREHLLADTIKNYLNRSLTTAELLAADAHLAGCDRCHAQLMDLQNAKSFAGIDFRSGSTEEFAHLDYALLEKYVDEKTDDVEREIADVHLQACADCSMQLDGLLQMRKLIEIDSQKQTVVAAAEVGRKSFFDDIRNFLAGAFTFKYGFAALTVVLIATLVGVFALLAKRDATNEIAVTTSPNVNVPLDAQATKNVTAPNDANVNATPNSSAAANMNTSANVNTNSNKSKQQPDNNLKSLPPASQTEVARALDSGRLNLPAELNALNNKNGVLMGDESPGVPFALAGPVGKIIRTDRPQFRWNKLSEAESYVVNVYDADFNLVATSPKLDRTNWQPDKPLARGKTYLWQVTANVSGEEIKSPTRPAPDARFKVLDQKKADELERLARSAKNEPLLLGIAYANAGLLDEAESEFRKELAANPNSQQAKKFLADIRARKR